MNVSVTYKEYIQYLVEYTYNIMYNSNFVLNRKKMMRPQFVDGLTTPKK